MGLGDLPGQDQADAAPLGLGGEEGDEQVGGVGQSLPLVLHGDLQLVADPSPADAGSPSGLRRGIDGVPDQVDQQLIQLIRIGPKPDRPAVSYLHRHPCLETHDFADRVLDEDRALVRGRKPGEPGIGAHEPAQRPGPGGDDAQTVPEVLLPVRVRKVMLQERFETPGNGLDGGQRVVQLMAQHPDQPPPRLPLLFPQGLVQVRQNHQVMRPPLLAKHGPAHSPAAAPPGQTDSERPDRLSLHAVLQIQFRRRFPQRILSRNSQEPLAGPVDEPQAPSVVECEDRHVDLFHHLLQQGGRLDRSQALPPQDLAQNVQLRGELAQSLVRSAPGPDGEVPFTKRRDHVGEGLKLKRQLPVQQDQAARQGAHGQQREAVPHPGLVIAGPEQDQQCGAGGEACRERDQDDPRLEAEAVHSPSFSMRR